MTTLGLLLIFLVLALGILAALLRLNGPDTDAADGRWELHTWGPNKEGRAEMISLRWSIPEADGSHFATAHYPNTTWGQVALESQAKKWNAEGRRPSEFTGYQRMKASAQS